MVEREPVTDGRGGLVTKPPSKRWEVGKAESRIDESEEEEDEEEESEDGDYEDVKEDEDEEDDNNDTNSEEKAKDKEREGKVDKIRLLKDLVNVLNRNLR